MNNGMFGGGMNVGAVASQVEARTPMEAMRVMAQRPELMGGMAQIAQAIVELEERIAAQEKAKDEKAKA